MAKPVKHHGKWRIRWIDAGGRRMSEVYDGHNNALLALQRHQVEAEETRRGLRSPTAPAKTFDDIAAYWLQHRAPQKRSGKDDESIIRRHLVPAFGGTRLVAFTTAQVDRFRAEKSKLNPKTVANHLTLLIAMLNVAKDLGWIAAVPRIRKPQVRLLSEDFRYLRTREEIDRFLRASESEGHVIRALYATAIFTGLRAGELAALRWEDIDFERRLITVQRSFEGPTKAGDVRYVPIVDALVPILRDLSTQGRRKNVFPNNRNEMLQRSARAFQEILHRVLARAGFPRVGRRRFIVFHDLRHTFASHWVMNGGDLFKLQRILGHKSIAMTQRYAHLHPSAFSEDFGRFGTGVEIAPVIRLTRGS